MPPLSHPLLPARSFWIEFMSAKLIKPFAALAIACAIFAGVVFLASNRDPQAADPQASLLDTELTKTFGPADYAAALLAADQDLDLFMHRLEQAPDEWLNHSTLAMGHLIRAQLTGSFDELVLAEDAIEQSVELAPEGSPPAVSASTINLSLHRYQTASQFIDRYDGFAVKIDKAEEAEMQGQRGEIAFYSGDYSSALTHFSRAFADSPTPNNIFRLANWQKYCGEFDEAISLYVAGAQDQRFATPQMLAAYHLQIGALELQRGNWELAAKFFRKADELFPGHWLARAHVAQMLAVEGSLSEAEAIYLDIIREHENPDVMIALADLREFRGDNASADAIRARASKLFEQRLQAFPEAYYDHALDLALSNGDNKRALQLAQANFDARPFGDAQMALARAHSANGDPERALELLMEVKRSGWNAVELNLDIAEAYRLSGNSASADMFEHLALQMNPRALDPKAQLLAFGSH